MAANDKVLKDPAPNVFIDDVDNRGYVFNVTANVTNPRDVYGVRSDLFFAVTQKLREAGIALGNPLASGFVDSESTSSEV
jgi:small-conductance mechanosensitive channel